MKCYVSVIVCVYNEENNIAPLISQIENALSHLDYEIVYVDDGSRDGTLAELKKITNPRLRVVEFRRNYGQSAALAAGIEYADGDWLVSSIS